MMIFDSASAPLEFRPLTMADAGAIFEAIYPYPDLPTFMTWKMPTSPSEVAQKLMSSDYDKKTNFGIFQDGQFIGRALLNHFRDQSGDHKVPSAFISFWVLPPYENKGLEEKAIDYLCSVGFHTKNLGKLFADVFKSNPLAQKALLSQGFEKVGTLQSHYQKEGIEYDCVRFEKLNEAFFEALERDPE